MADLMVRGLTPRLPTFLNLAMLFIEGGIETTISLGAEQLR